MNSNLDAYLTYVCRENAAALSCGTVALEDSLPCYVCRELEAPLNEFVRSSDPLVVSYRALSRTQHVTQPSIPRKIEFESAVYLKEGLLDRLFGNSPVTLLFIGDGTSDKRFSYNCRRLFGTFNGSYRIYSFICNAGLIGKSFGPGPPATAGWDEHDPHKRLFYHASTWSELTEFLELAESERSTRQVLIVVDIDGTYLCPRPDDNEQIVLARREAIMRLSGKILDHALFDPGAPADATRLTNAVVDASQTGFTQAYDDADLTMLVALGLYADIIGPDDPLLNPRADVGFSVPIEWLQYAGFVIANRADWVYALRQLRSLYVSCGDAIKNGSPTAFRAFREMEERVLVERAKEGAIRLNRGVTAFILATAEMGCVPIAFSDRPNASLGLESTGTPAHTARAIPDALVSTRLQLTP